MTSTSPYRTRPTPVSTRVVSPATLPRRLLAVLIVTVGAPILLHVFLWSRVVTVRCERDPLRRIWCDVDESSLALSSRFRREATRARRAEAVGSLRRSRGDVWIALSTPGGATNLTSGFNGDKEGQIAVAKELTRFLLTPDERSVTLSFGSRWRTAWIFAGLDTLLFLFLYPIFGQRLRVATDRARDTLEFRRRLWPLPAAHIVVPLSRLHRIAVENERPNRYQLVAVTDDQSTHPLSWPLGAASVLAPAAETLQAWVEEERARYRSGGDG